MSHKCFGGIISSEVIHKVKLLKKFEFVFKMERVELSKFQATAGTLQLF